MIETISWVVMIALLVFAVGYPFVLIVHAVIEQRKEKR